MTVSPPSLTLGHVTFDAADATALATFWSSVLDRPVDEGATEFFATVGMTGDEPLRPAFMFIQVPEPRTGKNRIHVDLLAADWQIEVERVVGVGAIKVGEFGVYGAKWVTLADPEGNLFDLAHSGE